jgi:hypothetical protein
MDILLINPYYSQLMEYYSFYRLCHSVGLMYIAGYLRKYGMDCRIYELGVFDAKDAIELAGEWDWDKRAGEILNLIDRTYE